MDTDGHGFYRREQSQRRGNKVATKKARPNPIVDCKTAELPQKHTKNPKVFGLLSDLGTRPSDLLPLPLQRGGEPAPQFLRLFQTHGKSNQVTRDAAGLSPIQFGVMRQQGERAREGKDRAQAWAFAKRQPIIDCGRSDVGILGQKRNQRAPAAVGPPAPLRRLG